MISKHIWLLLLLLAAACTPGATQPGEPENSVETVTMWVGPETADCVGEAPQTCLQVRFEEEGEWQLFYDSIAGFEYEPGFEYELRVNKTEVANPPADSSSIRYELVDVVTQTAVTSGADASMLEQLLGSDWNLISWEGVTILPDSVPTLAIEEDGLGGTTGCNHYFGMTDWDGANLTVGEVEMTEMFCEGVMEQERAYIQALQTAESITLAGDTLTIHTTEGDLTFQPPTQATLTDTQWVLGGIAQGEAVVSTWVDSEITSEFKEGNMAGSAGCNSYSAPYEVEGTSLTLGQVVNTLMACEDEERNQRESEFLTALMSVAQYEIHRNTLTLSDAEGNLVLTFQVQAN
jgi:heat shock protein HslJ